MSATSFIVKSRVGGGGPVRSEMFDTESEALERAAQVIDDYGFSAAVEVWREGAASEPLRNFNWIYDWRRNKRLIPNPEQRH
jgi:hypothetical protein